MVEHVIDILVKDVADNMIGNNVKLGYVTDANVLKEFTRFNEMIVEGDEEKLTPNDYFNDLNLYEVFF